MVQVHVIKGRIHEEAIPVLDVVDGGVEQVISIVGTEDVHFGAVVMVVIQLLDFGRGKGRDPVVDEPQEEMKGGEKKRRPKVGR